MALFICQGCGAEHSGWEGKCPQCGASETIRLQAHADRIIDRVIKGKFKIIRKLGQGGMGAVYLAEQVGIGQRVALKFLKSEFSSDVELARRFLNEAKSYARVAHPNAVTLHDFGQDEEGNLFIAMEYCEGVDLKKVITEQGRLPVHDAIEIALQVADVLATAHARGVIHRDLKPENIMIRRGLRGVHAKVLDFGIARLMDAGTRLTLAGSIAGTPRYMPPEQVEGKADIDHRADIYSLGVLLFEELTGQAPFDGATIAEILRKQVVEPMPHLVERAPDVDYPEIDAVIQKACAKRREDRWPDLLTFADALSKALPTAQGLASPSLHRATGLSALGLATGQATPAPNPYGGVALPGTAVTDQEVRAPTMLRTARDLGGAVTRAAGPGGSTLAAEDEIHPPAKSKGPLIALVAVGLLVMAGLGAALWGGQATVTATSGQGGGALEPTALTVDAGVAPPVPRTSTGAIAGSMAGQTSPAGSVVDLGEATRLLREEASRHSLSQGRTELEVAQLDSAETYLKAVAEGTAAYPEAQQLVARIKDIRETLAEANRRRASGHCATAFPLYQRVLNLNPKIADARAGWNACRAAEVDPTMP